VRYNRSSNGTSQWLQCGTCEAHLRLADNKESIGYLIAIQTKQTVQHLDLVAH